MKESHVELIDPLEKISPELGGTGYVGPKRPDSAIELAINAKSVIESFPQIAVCVWKVLRSSVNWKQSAKTRRLVIEGRCISCEVIGGIREWWFVAVDARKVVEQLEAGK